ncbi:5'/3'-nucleotidase SurE [Leptodesmis sp.]|uniref:5'/3'-nucleotidase SurE n=1 Tax=Leptodesmis sp. TaxID=3100501 RepID=UPI00405348A5
MEHWPLRLGAWASFWAVNSGGNLGADVHVSGTVAAVRKASLHRTPGVDISHYRQGKREIDWEPGYNAPNQGFSYPAGPIYSTRHLLECESAPSIPRLV